MASKIYFGGTRRASFTGYYPSIAANSSGNLVCAYNCGEVKYGVYIAVGKFVEGDVVWNCKGLRCAGEYPRVAINNANKVVIVYTRSGKIKYQIGEMTESRNSIGWYDEYEVCEGYYPSIAFSGNNILLAYELARKCYYCFGQFDEASFTITWNKGVVLHEDAKYPSVAMNNDFVVALFSSRLKKQTIMSVVGQIKGNDITWSGKQNHQQDCGSKQDSQEEDTEGTSEQDPQDNTEEASKQDQEDTEHAPKQSRTEQTSRNYPSVAMFEDGLVIAAFQKNLIFDQRVLALRGKVSANKDKIEWHCSKNDGNCGGGRWPSVAAVKSSDTQKIFVEMHSSKPSLWKQIYYQECIITM